MKSKSLEREITSDQVSVLGTMELSILHFEVVGRPPASGTDFSKAVKTVETAVAQKDRAAPAPGSRRPRKIFDRPPRGDLRNWVAGTQRAFLILLLQEGATFPECMSKLGKNHTQTYDLISQLNTITGFGISETPDGVIRLSETRPEWRSNKKS